LAESSNSFVRRYAEDLREFAELRNAIIHRRTDALLAEPTEVTTTALERIVETFTNPPRIEAALNQRGVSVCQRTSRIRDAAAEMRTGNFSQLPVYDDDRFVALLTAETLMRWLSAELERHDGILEDAIVEQALDYVEDPENHAFLSRSATIFETLDLFNSFSLRGKTLDAIIITNDGRKTAPLNIVTIYDVPRLLQLIPGIATRLLA
jgi:CBS domain-containing protein